MTLQSLKERSARLVALAAGALLAASLVLSGCSAPSSTSSASSSASSSATTSDARAEAAAIEADGLRIGSLKGPTSIGLASMMEQDQGIFTVAASADEIAPQLLQDELDIVLVPANLAATLYQKTDGAIRAIDVNTLGVLYAVTAAEDVSSVEDLRGRTVYMTGKGTVPEYTVLALLEAAGIPLDEVDMQFRSEPAEVAALIAQDAASVGILPQPYATSATMQNESLKSVIDLSEAWERIGNGKLGSIVTGVTIAKAATVEAQPEAIAEFLQRHTASAAVADTDPAAIAEEVVSLGIIGNTEVALKAIPLCNAVCYTGEEMKAALSGYLEALFAQEPSSIGGEMPGEDFYYLP